jgi:hypothetical protein
VEAKIANFDIKGAVKLLSSDDSLTSFNEDVAEELKKKHPSPSRELFFPFTTIFNTVKQKKPVFSL